MNDAAIPYIERCPVGCDAPLEATGILLAEGALRRCTACGQLLSACSEQRFLESMGEFDDARGTDPVSGAEERRLRRSGRILEALRGVLGRAPGEMRLLDVGCSSGTFLGAAVHFGYRAEGVEPAPRAAQAARDKGLKVHTGLLHEARFPDASFDAITILEVIEHLREPLAVLRECRRILAPDGVLAIGTGNAASWTAQALGARWDYFQIERHGGHVSFFTPGSMALAAERAGFRLYACRTRRVSLAAGDDPQPARALRKLAGEALSLPAALLGRGHDMLALLRPA